MNEKTETPEKLPYSYHIFAWPFQIHGKSGDMGTPESYVGELTGKFKSGGWRELKAHELAATDEVDEREELLDRFMLWQYLSVAGQDIYEAVNPLPRSASEKESRNICRILRLRLDRDGNAGYTIEKTVENDNKEKIFYQYQLRLQKVELHVYKFGCGILFLYTENRKYPDIQDIQRIADYGRRIALPFLPHKPGGFILTADVLKLEIPNLKFKNSEKRVSPCLDFRNLEKEYNGRKKEVNARFLQDLVEVDSVDIVPFTDDRMFEIELIRNEGLSDALKNDWRNHAELQKTLYSLIFVDDGDPTCQNENMRRTLLEESIDPRWADYGTIHAATEFSMLCLTSNYDGILDSVIRPFTVEYPYLLSLVLAQRTGLAGYSEAAGHLAGKNVSLFTWRNNLIRLQKDFNVFRNQITIPEATNQDQGMEIYDLLRKQTRVLEQEELLDDQMEDLFDVADANFQTLLTWIALIFAVVSPFVEGFFAPLMEDWGKIGGGPLFALLGILLFFGCYTARKETRKKRILGFWDSFLKKRGNLILSCIGLLMAFFALASGFWNLFLKEQDSFPDEQRIQAQYEDEQRTKKTSANEMG